LDLPLEGKTPYNYLGRYTLVLTLAEIMKIHLMKFEKKVTIKGKVMGLPQGYLEWYLHQLMKKERWTTFMDVLALILYGDMLFPNIENLVDYTAINVFVAYKTQYENLVIAVLAKVYGTLAQCFELKRKKMLCCLLVLYVWFVSRVSKCTLHAICHVEELLHSKSELREPKEWVQLCADLNEEKIN